MTGEGVGRGKAALLAELLPRGTRVLILVGRAMAVGVTLVTTARPEPIGLAQLAEEGSAGAESE